MTPGPERPTWVYRIVRRVSLTYFRLVHRISFHGVDRVPTTGPFILVANHASFLDPPAVGCVFRGRQLHYMARDTLQKSRWMKWLMERMQVIPIDRTRGDIGALRSALRVLRQGKSIVVFPEGTRSVDGTLQPAKPGIGFLVAKAGVPVIPAHIQGTYNALSKHHRWVRPARVQVRYGEPILPEAFEALAGEPHPYEAAASLVMDRIAQTGRLLSASH